MTFPQVMTGRAVACARPLPAALIEARAAVFNPLLCQDLNQTARRVLFGILTFLNLARLHKAVFPRRDLLRAESLLNSEPILYRGLKALEVAGYITRSQERRVHNGEFSLSPITVTKKALSMLGLSGLIHKQRSLKVRDGQYIEHTKPEQSLQNTVQQAEVARQNLAPKDAISSPQTCGIRADESAPVNDIDPHTGLPKELLRLMALDVSKGAICWLMKQARGAGVRLSHVVSTVWHRIRSLRGREVVSYLKFMVHMKMDFAFVAKQCADTAAKEHADTRARAMLESLGERYRGFELVSADGVMLGVFEPSASGLHAIVGARGSIPVNLAFAKQVLAGGLRLRAPQDLYVHAYA
jgi:hypothetical protein